MWGDYCTIVKAYGGEWTVKWLNDGEVQRDVDSSRFALAIQPGQEIEVDGKLCRCDGYIDNRAIFVDPAKVKKKQVARARRKKQQVTTTDPERIAVAVAKALTAPANPDEEDIDAAYERINKGMAAAVQAKLLTKWARCRYAKLARKTQASLTTAYIQRKQKFPGFDEQLPYTFVERATQAYISKQKDKKGHVRARQVLLDAVKVTLGQVRPAAAKKEMLGGDAEALRDKLFPVLVKVFPKCNPHSKPPSKSPSKRKGPNSYVKRLIDNGNYTYSDMCKWEDLMQHHTNLEMKAGDHRGYPILKPGEAPASHEDAYDLDLALPEYKASALKVHPEIPLLRYAALVNAITFCKDTGEPPVMVRVPFA